MNNENNGTVITPQENGSTDNKGTPKPEKERFTRKHPTATKVIKGVGIGLGLFLLAVGGFGLAGGHFKGGNSKDGSDPVDDAKTESDGNDI